jgi:hypothetical protein
MLIWHRFVRHISLKTKELTTGGNTNDTMLKTLIWHKRILVIDTNEE